MADKWAKMTESIEMIAAELAALQAESWRARMSPESRIMPSDDSKFDALARRAPMMQRDALIGGAGRAVAGAAMAIARLREFEERPAPPRLPPGPKKGARPAK